MPGDATVGVTGLGTLLPVGFPILDGCRKVGREVFEETDWGLDVSEAATEVRILEIGSCGRADVGAGAGLDIEELMAKGWTRKQCRPVPTDRCSIYMVHLLCERHRRHNKMGCVETEKTGSFYIHEQEYPSKSKLSAS